ncbi:MAG: hypothetical protein NVS9B5_06260 [Terriglobales bacterium]
MLEECDIASVNLAPDPVHDLRVALRRCRSVADAFMAIDPDRCWKQMKKAGKRIFGPLGDLRDVQVMMEWLKKFSGANDSETSAFVAILAEREIRLKEQAARALQELDRKSWAKWSTTLPRRANRIKKGSAIFKHLALERYTEAYRLHQLALRNRSKVAFHNLRIGVKRFRYVVENFLPDQHQAWSRDLKHVQDLLGEVHDFDVLCASALQSNIFSSPDSRSRWEFRISEERKLRINEYREKMLGKFSPWQAWRSGLPDGDQIEAAALRRMKLWASALDPDFHHSQHVCRLALQLYDGLLIMPPDAATARERRILQLAALLHDVGRSKREKGHQKASYGLILGLKPPLGYDAESLHIAAAVARYHRGALPSLGQQALHPFTASQKQEILKLAGILRLASAFDSEHDGSIQQLKVEDRAAYIVISANGYSHRSKMAEGIAAARHLLEVCYRRPIMVKPLISRKASFVTAKLAKRVAHSKARSGNSSVTPINQLS